MASEMNMYQAQVNEYRYDVERLNRELQDTKRKYYQQKRKDQIVKDMGGLGGSVSDMNSAAMAKTNPQVLRDEQQSTAMQSRTKFAGGGFAVK
jgi:hypothetical protein